MPDTLDRLTAALADRYALQRELGRGGMATVYLAEDRKHHRPVALKVLRPELAAALGPDRFLREIEVSARLTHPHILPLHDSGNADGFLYYVMPYVEGESLRDRLTREKQLPVDDALQISHEVADALSYAHSHGVIHRDIKPENILLESGHAVVADFGIARAIDAAGGERLTETGMAMGTPQYMSPEQAGGSRDLDGRSDLYSLGCVLYEMLAGHPPFQGTTAHELLARHATDPVPPLKAARDTIPEPIEDAIGRVLAKAPADRFATAEQFRVALELDPAAFRHQQRRQRARRRVAAIAGALPLLAVITAAILIARRGRPSTRDVLLDTNLLAVLPFRVVSPDPDILLLGREMASLFELTVTGEFGPRAASATSVAGMMRALELDEQAPMTDSTALRVARELGAGAVVRGSVIQTDSLLTIQASITDAQTGRAIVQPTKVYGATADRFRLVDQLIGRLLAHRRLGEQARMLSRYKAEALQAYMAGRWSGGRESDWAVAKRHLRRAVEIDSSFVQAALLVYLYGESWADSAEARLAWERQDLLSPHDRALLRGLLGFRFGVTSTVRDVLAHFEEAVRLRPERSGTAWTELAEELLVYGPLAAVDGGTERARRALEANATETGGLNPFEIGLLQDAAIQLSDTSLARRSLTLIDQALQRPVRYPLAEVHRWRLALFLGDSMLAQRAAERLRDSSAPRFAPARVLRIAMADGRGVALADELVGRANHPMTEWLWARARGRYAVWRELWRTRVAPEWPPSAGPITVVREALFFGAVEDSSVRRAAQQLEAMASGLGDAAVQGNDRAQVLCWSTLWKLLHGDTSGVGRVRTDIGRGGRSPPFTHANCLGLVEVFFAIAIGRDTHAALLWLDSIARTAPLPTMLGKPYGQEIDFADEVQNLTLARLLPAYGDVDRAVAAVRRRPRQGSNAAQYFGLVDFLREEGRLSAMAADTAAALRAYGHYLALRAEPPDYPPWRAQWDSVRAELNALLRAKG